MYQYRYKYHVISILSNCTSTAGIIILLLFNNYLFKIKKSIYLRVIITPTILIARKSTF